MIVTNFTLLSILILLAMVSGATRQLKPLSIRKSTSVDSFLSRIVSMSKAVANPMRLQYISAMSTRVTYFLLQSVGVSKMIVTNKSKQRDIDPIILASALRDALLSVDKQDYIDITIPTSFATQLQNEGQIEVLSKNFKGIISVLQQDLRNIESGAYKYPYDLLPIHTQWNPISVIANELIPYVVDLRDVIDRTYRDFGQYDLKSKFISSKYPDYYLQNFHFQTDGWLSAKSAKLYDYQVESLFLGMRYIYLSLNSKF